MTYHFVKSFFGWVLFCHHGPSGTGLHSCWQTRPSSYQRWKACGYSMTSIKRLLESGSLHLLKKASAELLIRVHLCDAFLWVLWSTWDHKTKLVAIRNDHFYKNKKLLNINNNNLHQAHFTKIDFDSQKKNEKMNQSIFHHSINHPTLCPIKIQASNIKRILNMPGTSLDSTVNTTIIK